MPPITFTIEVEDDGTVVVNKFTKNVEDSAKKAGKSAGKMTKAFTGVRKGIGGVSKAVFSLRGLLVGLGAAAVVRSVLRASFAQEEAVTRLNASLRASGQFSDAASKSLQNFASQMQATTIFGDEVILNQIALAQAFGFTTENVQEAVEAAVELSAAAGIQLEEAVRRLGRSISGSVEDIAKFAPEIRNLTKEQLAAGEAAKVLGDALRGSAAAQADTARGRMIQLGNALGDVVEKIGQSITSSNKFVEALKGLAQGITDANNSVSGSGQFGDALAQLIPSAQTMVLTMEILTKIFQTFAAVASLSALGIQEFIFQIINLELVAEKAIRSVLGNAEAVQALTDQQKFLRLESDKSAQNAERNIRALLGLTNEQNKAAAAADKHANAQKKLGAEIAKATKETAAAAESTRKFEADLKRIEELGPVAFAVIRSASRKLAVEIALLPPALAREGDALLDQLSGFGFLTRGLVDQVAAELDRLKNRFTGLPLGLQVAFQQTAASLSAFFVTFQTETGKIFGEQVSQNQASITALLDVSTRTGEVFTAAQIQATQVAAAEAANRAAINASQVLNEKQKNDAIIASQKREAAAAKAISAAKGQALLSGALALAGSILTLADSGSRSAFEAAKALAIAEAIVSGISATNQALAAPPGPPFTIPLAASIAIQTIGNVKKIQATQFGGGGTAAPSATGTFAVAAAGAATGAERPPEAAGIPEVFGGPAAPVAGDLPVAPTQITISVSGFIGDEAELASALGEIISEAEGDDVEFQLS